MRATKAGILLRGYNVSSSEIVITEIVTDSRAVTAGCAFVCIKGERVDGHSYAVQALAQGASLIIAEHFLDNIPLQKLVIVDNALDAMIKMGDNYRSMFSPLIVGVTGSVGKTTTKEFCYAVFSEFGETLKTQGNQNNEIGLPNTLFKLSDNTKYAVIEMGMQGLGEIEKLTLAARPMGAIITGVGCAHLEQLKSRENILKAKMEICAGLPEGGVLVTPFEDEYLQNAKVPSRIHRYTFGLSEKADVYAKNILQGEGSCSFEIHDIEHGCYKAVIPAIGKHNVLNALSAYTLGVRLGLSPKRAALALSSFKTTGHRQNIVPFGGASIIEDCYNANPDSMRAALSALKDYPAKRRIALLGDMFELGTYEKAAHEEIGAFAAQIKADYVITVGTAAVNISTSAKNGGAIVAHCEDKQQALQLLLQYIKKGDAVLVKASHGMHFEEILQGLYEHNI